MKLSAGEELVDAAYKWFKESLGNEWLAEEYDYSEGDVEEIKSLNISDIEKIELSSMVDFEEFAVGSDITYDYTTKKRKRTKTGYDFYDF